MRCVEISCPRVTCANPVMHNCCPTCGDCMVEGRRLANGDSIPDVSDPCRTCICQVPCGPRREKTCLRGFVNNTGADQTEHPHSLISAFVIRFLESIIYKLATGDISNF